MEKQWISTIELLNYLKEHPNKEKECRLSLGYGLGSTHYWYWDPKTNMFMHSRDWDFEPPFGGYELPCGFMGIRWRRMISGKENGESEN